MYHNEDNEHNAKCNTNLLMNSASFHRCCYTAQVQCMVLTYLAVKKALLITIIMVLWVTDSRILQNHNASIVLD